MEAFMNLTEAFEEIAQDTIRQQTDERNLRQCLEHAKPLLNILSKIKAAAGTQNDQQFYFSNDHFHTSSDGYLTLQVGLTKDGNWIPVQGGEPDKFNRGLTKSAVFSIHVNGHVHAVRYDQGEKNFLAPCGYDFTVTKTDNVKVALPFLSAWVEDNMPEVVESIIPKPVVSTGGGIHLTM